MDRIYRIRLVCEPGVDPLTGEALQRSEEVLKVEASSLWEAFRKATLQMTLTPGGRLLRGYDAATREEAFPPSPQSFRQSRFAIEDVQGPYEGFTSGEMWNGWAVPYFEYDEAWRVAADYARVSDDSDGDMAGSRARYDLEMDAIVLYDPIYDEETAYRSITIITDGRAVTVYPVGAREWTWAEVQA